MKKILVVEDNEDNRDILVQRLQRMGSFEILIVQWQGGDGGCLELQARLGFYVSQNACHGRLPGHASPAPDQWGKDLPIIAVTAHAGDEDRNKALSAGCCDFIPKPILDYSLVEKKIRNILGPQSGPMPS